MYVDAARQTIAELRTSLREQREQNVKIQRENQALTSEHQGIQWRFRCKEPLDS